jgi:hypothetical protein
VVWGVPKGCCKNIIPGYYLVLLPSSQPSPKSENHGFRRRSKKIGFSSPVFGFLKTGEVPEGVDLKGSQQPLSTPGGVGNAKKQMTTKHKNYTKKT